MFGQRNYRRKIRHFAVMNSMGDKRGFTKYSVRYGMAFHMHEWFRWTSLFSKQIGHPRYLQYDALIAFLTWASTLPSRRRLWARWSVTNMWWHSLQIPWSNLYKSLDLRKYIWCVTTVLCRSQPLRPYSVKIYWFYSFPSFNIQWQTENKNFRGCIFHLRKYTKIVAQN